MTIDFKNIFKASRLIPVGFFLLACVVELLAIAKLNSGKFIYTLDDPYIHLALSENIARGHYGVNLQEFSAPSSSIIWPFLLAPFTAFSWFEYVPLILNIVFSILSITIVISAVETIFKRFSLEGRSLEIVKALIGVAFIFCTNLIALTFSGMEHVLQIMCTIAIISGLIHENESGNFPAFAIFALILAPLVRYENAALSGCVILFLLYRRHFKTAVLSAIIIAAFIIGFSLFLHSLDLGFIPTSITIKSRTGWQTNKIVAVLKTILENVTERQGAVLLALLALLLKPAFSRSKIQFPALIGVVAIAFHVIFGNCMYGRYTNYITAAALLIILYSYVEFFRDFFLKTHVLLKSGIIAISTIFIGANFIADAALSPLASNNIYEQQHQMGRFVREYYRRPVAVNDLGLVSFKNDTYVLDLWGLASKSAFEMRAKEMRGGDPGDWMNDFSQRENVKFAMIYEPWFHKIPQNWHKVAQLHLSKMKLTPAYETVDFYSLDVAKTPELVQKLNAFKTTLPPGVRLNIIE